MKSIKISTVRVIFARNKVGSLDGLTGAFIYAMFKQIFVSHIMTYIYTHEKGTTELEAIRSFFATYGITENDWAEEAAERFWRRYKSKIGLSEKTVQEVRSKRSPRNKTIALPAEQALKPRKAGKRRQVSLPNDLQCNFAVLLFG